MRGDPPEESQATDNSSIGGQKRKRDPSNHWSVRNPLSHSCSLHRLPVIGDKIRNKGDNNIRIYFENFNGIRSVIKGADKGVFWEINGDLRGGLFRCSGNKFTMENS